MEQFKQLDESLRDDIDDILITTKTDGDTSE